MKAKVDPREVKRWVDLLRSSSKADRPRTAVRTRGAIRTRKGVVAKQPGIEDVIEKLVVQPADVRREVISALGEQADELAVSVLERLSKREPEWRVRLSLIQVLAKAGGPHAIEVLKELARTDPSEDVRTEAVQALGDLALAAWPQLGVRTRGAPRVRGAVRVRGTAPSRSISPEADAILSLLDQIRSLDPSVRVREAAEDTLGRLDV
jgi:HEAT repeat protein